MGVIRALDALVRFADPFAAMRIVSAVDAVVVDAMADRARLAV